jgi:hypothetical protein
VGEKIRRRGRAEQYKPEEIVAKLRQVDVLVSQGQPMGDATPAIEAWYHPSIA